MNYAEATYFAGAHFAHIAARDEKRRLDRKLKDVRRVLDRRNGSR